MFIALNVNIESFAAIPRLRNICGVMRGLQMIRCQLEFLLCMTLLTVCAAVLAVLVINLCSRRGVASDSCLRGSLATPYCAMAAATAVRRVPGEFYRRSCAALPRPCYRRPRVVHTQAPSVCTGGWRSAHVRGAGGARRPLHIGPLVCAAPEDYSPPWTTNHLERTAEAPRAQVVCANLGGFARSTHYIVFLWFLTLACGGPVLACAQTSSVCTLVQLQSISPTVRHAVLRVEDAAFSFLPGQVRTAVAPSCSLLGTRSHHVRGGTVARSGLTSTSPVLTTWAGSLYAPAPRPCPTWSLL